MNNLDFLRKYVPLHAERVADTIRLLIRIALMSIRADEGSILLVSEDKKSLVFADTVGDGLTNLSGTKIPIGHGITGMAALTQDIQIGSRAANDMKSVPGDNTPNSIVAVPLIADDELIGVMTLVRITGNNLFTLQDGELYLMIAAIAALVIQQQHQLDARDTNCAPMSDRESSKGNVLMAVADLIDKHPDYEEVLLALTTALAKTAR